MTEGQRSHTRPVSDPKAWLALAHPLRLRLLNQLQMRQAARATDLAEALGAAPNSVSFHLRQLERFGYVERDETHQTDARERWWRSTSPAGFRVANTETDPDAASQLTAVMRQRAHDQVDQWYDAVEIPDHEWPDAPRTTNFDLHLLLTNHELDEFFTQLSEVFNHWMHHTRSADATARTEFTLFGYGMPQPALDEAQRRHEA